MIVTDVNVLVYAYRVEAVEHEQCTRWLADTLAGVEPFGLLDTVLSGFVRIVTNPRVFADPAPTTHAMTFVDRLVGDDRSVWIAPSEATWRTFAELAASDRHVRGNLVPDAFIAATALANNARVATRDSGFARFPKLHWFDPAAAT